QRHTADNSGGYGNEGERFPVAGHSTQPVALGVGRCNAGALSLSIARGPRRRRFVTMRAWMRGRRRGVAPNIRWMEWRIAGPLSSGKKSATLVFRSNAQQT